jgi:uncharacterized protein involved in exopolysaccharide biosynthesis
MTPTPVVDREVSVRVFNALVVLMRWRRWVIVAFVVGAVAGGALSFMVVPRYEASVRFIAETRGGVALPTGLTGLAAQFGVPVMSTVERSPQFYEQLVTGDALLGRLLAESLTVDSTSARPRSLLDLLAVGGRSPDVRYDVGIRRLRSRIRPSVDNRSGMITVRVSMASPSLAAAVASRVASLVDEFDQVTRRTRGGDRRLFAQRRYQEASAALRAVEDSLAGFLEANRRYEGSPGKILAEQRLRRRLQTADELAETLLRELETARLAEVDDRPAITITDPPRRPVRRSYPGRSRFAIVGGMVAATTVALLALVIDSGIARAWRRDFDVARRQ